jgi:arylsulfatase A-like enzyme
MMRQKLRILSLGSRDTSGGAAIRARLRVSVPLWFFFLSGFLTAMASGAEQRPPNVVFILADDLGWADLGCYGSTFYETPNLDRLASQSVRFTQAYAACPVCSPTRASILTGKYPARLRLTDWLPGRPDGPTLRLRRPAFTKHLALEEVTLAEALRDARYATGIVGKWHLGGPAFYPEKQGFDVNVAGCELGHPPSYFSPYKIPNLKDGPEGEYLTDRMTEEAVRFIEHHRDRPFFLYLSHYAVHMPKEAKANLAEQFKAKADALPPPAGPKFRPEGKHEDRRVQDDHVYAAMVKSLDEGVGRVLQKLTALGLDDRTIVIFFSDNGGLSTAEGSPTSNAPLRAGKGWLYEGGIREPLMVRWPGVTRAGRVIDQPVISTDFYPTILAMTGQPPRPDQHVDGISFAPLLKGDDPPAPPQQRDALFWHYPHYANQGGGPAGAVRQGDWKLIEDYEDFHVELYNLKDDPGESKDHAADLPDRANELRKRLHDWRHDVDAQMPTPNPDYRPARANK